MQPFIFSPALKRTIVCCLTSMALATHAQAGDDSTFTKPQPRIEVSVGYGRATLVTLLQGVHGGEYGYDASPISSYTGTLSFSARAHIAGPLFLGIAIAFENEKGTLQDFIYPSGNGTRTYPTGSFKRNVWSIASEVLFRYSKRNKIYAETYGYFGIGNSFLNEQDNYNDNYYNGYYHNGINALAPSKSVVNNISYLTFQICPIGLSIGRTLRGFAELGFGYKGIFNCGLALKL